MKKNSNVKANVIKALVKRGASPSDIALILQDVGINPLRSHERRKEVSLPLESGYSRIINVGTKAVPEGMEAREIVPVAIALYALLSKWREASEATADEEPWMESWGDGDSEETPEEREFYKSYEII